MPPFLPLVGLSRSQDVRIGRGPGNTVVSQMNMGDEATNPQKGGIFSTFYADLGQAHVRKDLQRHAAIGAFETVGVASNTVYSDLFSVDSGFALTPSASNLTVAVGAGHIASRFYGTKLAVSGATVTLTAPSFGGQMNYIYVGPNGSIGVWAGVPDLAAPTYEAWSFTAGAATLGTFTVQFLWNGFIFTTAGIAYNATGAAVATAITGATGGPNNATFGDTSAGTVTGGGTALPTGPATAVFSAGAEGPVVPLFVDSSGLTGGTAALTRTTVGVGAQSPFPSGNALVLGGYYVPAGTTAASAATALTSVTLTA